MTGTVMLWNPVNRKGKKMAKRKRRHLTAKQARYFGTKAQRAGAKRATRSKRRSTKRRSRGMTVAVVKTNPRSSTMAKRKHRGKRRSARRHGHVRHRRIRRNPITGGFLSTMLPAALTGAGGALAVDYLESVLPISSIVPQSMQNNPIMQPIIDIGMSLLVGLGVEAVAGAKAGGEAAAGGIVVALYNFAQANLMPALTGQSAQGQMGQQGYGNGYGGGFGQGGSMGTGGNFGGGGGYGQQQGLNRYLARINRQRMLRGLMPVVAPQAMRWTRGLVRRRGMRGLGVIVPGRRTGIIPLQAGQLDATLGALNNRLLGATSPFSWTGRRMFRNMGYIGPARTIGRYLQPR